MSEKQLWSQTTLTGLLMLLHGLRLVILFQPSLCVSLRNRVVSLGDP